MRTQRRPAAIVLVALAAMAPPAATATMTSEVHVVSGTVRAADGSPVEAATVAVSGTALSARTDARHLRAVAFTG